MSEGETIFRVDRQELVRRQTAYDTLLVSLVSGLVFSFTVFDLPLNFSSVFLLPVIILGLVSRIWLHRFFKKYADSQVILAADSLTRTGPSENRTINFTDIRSMQIVKTSRGLVRSLGIITKSGPGMIINGVEEFPGLVDRLTKNCPGADIRNSREPVDYDHPLFYFFLGLGLAVGTGGLAAMLMTQNSTTRLIVYILIGVLVVVTGLYLYFTRPVSGYYTN